MHYTNSQFSKQHSCTADWDCFVYLSFVERVHCWDPNLEVRVVCTLREH